MDRVRQILFALLLVGAGVVLLLQQAEVIPKDVGLWPMILMGVGFLWFVERFLWGGGGYLFPLVVFAIGLGLLLEDLEAIDDDVVLPLVVIAIGVGMILSMVPRRGARAEPGRVPLEGATRARVEVTHGAGRLRIGTHIGGENLVEGTFAGGVDVRRHRQDDRAEVRLSTRGWGAGFPWGRHGGLGWSMTLARQVPIELWVKSGASSAEIDLSDSRVEDLRIETGASKTVVTIPATGEPKVVIRGGATEIRVAVPARMAARIQVLGGMTDLFVDLHRFHKVGEREYRSPDLDGSPNRADIRIEAGAAKVEVT